MDNITISMKCRNIRFNKVQSSSNIKEHCHKSNKAEIKSMMSIMKSQLDLKNNYPRWHLKKQRSNTKIDIRCKCSNYNRSKWASKSLLKILNQLLSLNRAVQDKHIWYNLTLILNRKDLLLAQSQRNKVDLNIHSRTQLLNLKDPQISR